MSDKISTCTAVFKWLSKVFTWLRLLWLVIGIKESRQFFNQWESKPKPIAPRTRDFSRASSKLQVIPRNCDWFIALPAHIVIGWSNCFDFGFSTVIWKPLYLSDTLPSLLWEVHSPLTPNEKEQKQTQQNSENKAQFTFNSIRILKSAVILTTGLTFSFRKSQPGFVTANL